MMSSFVQYDVLVGLVVLIFTIFIVARFVKKARQQRKVKADIDRLAEFLRTSVEELKNLPMKTLDDFVEAAKQYRRIIHEGGKLLFEELSPEARMLLEKSISDYFYGWDRSLHSGWENTNDTNVWSGPESHSVHYLRTLVASGPADVLLENAQPWTYSLEVILEGFGLPEIIERFERWLESVERL